LTIRAQSLEQSSRVQAGRQPGRGCRPACKFFARV